MVRLWLELSETAYPFPHLVVQRKVKRPAQKLNQFTVKFSGFSQYTKFLVSPSTTELSLYPSIHTSIHSISCIQRSFQFYSLPHYLAISLHCSRTSSGFKESSSQYLLPCLRGKKMKNATLAITTIHLLLHKQTTNKMYHRSSLGILPLFFLSLLHLEKGRLDDKESFQAWVPIQILLDNQQRRDCSSSTPVSLGSFHCSLLQIIILQTQYTST